MTISISNTWQSLLRVADHSTLSERRSANQDQQHLGNPVGIASLISGLLRCIQSKDELNL